MLWPLGERKILSTRSIYNSDKLGKYTIDKYKVVSNLDGVPTEKNYIIMEHDQSNLVNLHIQMCMIRGHLLSKYNNGEYECCLKRINYLTKNISKNPPSLFYYRKSF